LINIQNVNYSLSAAQIYCELSVGTPLSTCYHRLSCINPYAANEEKMVSS